MEILFWTGVLGAVYSYFLYPVLLLMLPRRRIWQRVSADAPVLTVIIAAHNEASRIRAKLDNTLACGYARGRREVIVASDACDDGTDEIVRDYAARGVRLVRSETRLGKEHAQRLAIEASKGEVLVFTDVGTQLDLDGLRRITGPFSDPRVGAVSSEDRFLGADGKPAGEGAYVRYEMALRHLEASVAGLVGLSGSFFAARREVCSDWDTGSPSDFNTALQCVRRHFVAVVAPDAFGYYRDISAGSREYRRKYRTVLRGMASLWRHPSVLNPFRHGLFAWQVWSHKVMRWAVPWFLLALFVASINLPGNGYRMALMAQLAFYAVVLAGALSTRLRGFGPVRLAYFFMEVNAAIAHAWVAFLLGSRITTWEPSKR
jgi:glycosyltransferase involved in cell wall biosynthesis